MREEFRNIKEKGRRRGIKSSRDCLKSRDQSEKKTL